MFNPLKGKGKFVPHPPSSLSPSPNSAAVLGFLAPTWLSVVLRGHSLLLWELLSHPNREVTGPGQSDSEVPSTQKHQDSRPRVKTVQDDVLSAPGGHHSITSKADSLATG